MSDVVVNMVGWDSPYDVPEVNLGAGNGIAVVAGVIDRRIWWLVAISKAELHALHRQSEISWLRASGCDAFELSSFRRVVYTPSPEAFGWALPTEEQV